MPDQIRRLLIVTVLLLAVFIFVRKYFTPKTFGEQGYFRAAAIDSVASLPIKFAGHQMCDECHSDVEEAKSESFHRNVNCEACHGPALDHIESDAEILPPAPRKRGYCPLCHEYNPARPTGFPQIDPIAHNPGEPCISCHNPHAPDPPHTPGDCSACHANVSRTKALSPHAPLDCRDCHKTPEEHKVSPRRVKPEKPISPDLCKRCHDKRADSSKRIPRVDVSTHGQPYLCWQCHYPHFPEANK